MAGKIIIKVTAVLGILLMVASGASAQPLPPPPKFSVAAFVERQNLGVIGTGTEIEPVIATAAVGYWVRRGIALELEAGIGLAGDSIGSLDADSTSLLGANLRFESTPTEGFSAYALFGYVRTTYDLSDNGSNTSIALPGGRFALGLTYDVRPRIHLDVAFTHHNYDGDTRINSFRFGVRYDFDSWFL